MDGPAQAHDETDASAAYAGLAEVDAFARLADPALYAPLPDAWVVLVADIVRSTAAIAAGRYKTVNAVGAAVIAAVSNALPGVTFPFVFGGDGAGLALPPEHAEAGAAALAATALWAREALDLELRAARVPVASLRAAGFDVRVARFAPSRNVSYAMFSGGGLAHAEAGMKAGENLIPPAAPGARPDLTGLNCRFAPVPARRGLVLSLIAVARPGADPAAFRALAEAVLALAETDGGGRPLPDVAPLPGLPREALRLEIGARPGPRPWAVLVTWLRVLAASAIFRVGRPLRGFDPARYRRALVENSDFRKFDDGLRMTLDVSAQAALAIEARLEEAARAGVAAYGLHRQDASLVTCFVPNATRSDHVHFIDGAGGGYARAAADLKRRLGAATEAA